MFSFFFPKLYTFSKLCAINTVSFSLLVVHNFMHSCFLFSIIILRMSAAYTACGLCKKLIYRIGSAHLICLSSIPPFLHTIQYVCHHSAIFAHHSIDLYSYRMSVVSVSIAVWDRFCHSAVFAHVSSLYSFAVLHTIQHVCIDIGSALPI